MVYVLTPATMSPERTRSDGSRGRDAVDVALTTSFKNKLVEFNWAEMNNKKELSSVR